MRKEHHFRRLCKRHDPTTLETDICWHSSFAKGVLKKDLIGYKKTYTKGSFGGDSVITKLLIPAGTRTHFCNLSGKCRAEMAIVLSNWNLDRKNWEEISFAQFPRKMFAYRYGSIVIPTKKFSEKFMECASGIHFFLTEEEAKAW